MLLFSITIGCMLFTLAAKWISVTALEQRRNRMIEANEMNGQARFRLKAAVQEVTNNTAEIEKLKRKIKISERKIERLQDEFRKYHAKAVQQAEIDSEKLRLIEELKKRKGMA